MSAFDPKLPLRLTRVLVHDRIAHQPQAYHALHTPSSWPANDASHYAKLTSPSCRLRYIGDQSEWCSGASVRRVSNELDQQSAFTFDSVYPNGVRTGTTARCLPAYKWTVLIPFNDEETFIGGVINSLAVQTEPFDLILIDNASTDSSSALAQALCERMGIEHIMVHEPRPGKVYALATGLALAQTQFVATMDADTKYPRDYLQNASRIFQDPSCVAAQAFYVRRDWRDWRRAAAAIKVLIMTRLLPHQSHTGGAGQVFRTSTLRLAGGFDAKRWSFILEDHEIIHRVSRFGAIRADKAFCCSPARRENDFARTRWTLRERLLYHFTPARLQPWFFYDFLAPRLRARAGPRGKYASLRL
jgi:hypothetical protein